MTHEGCPGVIRIRLLFAIALTLASTAWSAPAYKVLYSFTGGYDGRSVHAGVAFDTKGTLHGTTTGGGVHGEGTAFELKLL